MTASEIKGRHIMAHHDHVISLVFSARCISRLCHDARPSVCDGSAL